jgi:hypothetical protein
MISPVAMQIMDRVFAHGAFYLGLSRVRCLSDLILCGTDEFPEHGRGFHLNSFSGPECRSIILNRYPGAKRRIRV